MTIPYPIDPSLPSNPTPLFSDSTAARGDHLRANNAEIWANFAEIVNTLDTLNTLNELAAAPQNLVYNYDFRYYSNQLSTIASWYSYKHPDGWVYTDSGTDGKIGYDTASECCKFQTSSDGIGTRSFKQALHEFVNWKKLLQGKTVTLKAFLKGANATVRITDGVTSQSAALQNTGGIEEITLQIVVSAVATELTVLIESSTASNTIEVYKVYANRGNYAIETLPCIIQGKIGELKSYDATEIAPAGEFECNGIELPAGYTRLDSFLNGKFGTGSNKRSNLQDGRGRFERQWAHGTGVDPDAASRTTRGDGTTGDHVGTLQSYALLGHHHDTQWWMGTGPLTTGYPWIGTVPNKGGLQLNSGVEAKTAITDGTSVLKLSTENRPVNVYVLKTIRWC